MKIKKPPVGVRVLLGIVSVILCLALFCTTVVTMVITDLKVLTSKDGVQTIITQLVFAGSQKKAPVYRFQAAGVGGVRLDDMQIPEGVLPEGGSADFIVDFLYDYLSKEMDGELDISKEEVGALLEDSTIPEFVTDKMSSMVSDIITGESTTEITKDEILDLVEENKQIIEDVIGQELPQEVIDQIADVVEENNVVETVKEAVEVQLGLKPSFGESEDEGVSVRPAIKENVIQGVLSGKNTFDDVMNGGIPTLLALFREITSTTVLLSLLGVCLALIGLLFASNYWKPHAALRGVGISVMLAALPFVAATAAVQAVPALFADPAMQIVAMIIQVMIPVTFGVFGGGIALLIGSIVWGSQRKKKLLRMAAEPVESAPAVEAEVPVAENTEV
jgi:uncharacterized membrane protein